jgi:TBC1 domain family member 15
MVSLLLALNMIRIGADCIVVNELANTIDLESTLVRAEALFRRFQRTVEAIDKKQNFPAPKLRQRPVQNASSGATELSSFTSTGESASGTTTGANVTSGKPNSPDTTKEKARVSQEEMPALRKTISPELRKLLSRKVEVLPRKVVQRKGDGLDRKKG